MQYIIAQNLITYNTETYDRYANLIYNYTDNLHSSIKPLTYHAIPKKHQADSMFFTPTNTNRINYFLNKDFIKFNTNNINLSLNPVINELFLYDALNNKTLYQHKFGFSILGTINKLHTFYFNYSYNNCNYPSFYKQKIETTHVIPHNGSFEINNNNNFTYNNLSFFWSVNAGKYFNIKAGQGKNFWGDGYRSLLLSDNSKYYPYLQLSLDIWKIKYSVLYSFLRDINYPDPYYILEDKYTASHILSWNATKWLNIGLFESVIWNGGETSGNRGFEINYLNPIIFFRPVEFSLDDPSPDNVLLGFFYKFKLGKKLHYYGQFILDDFNFAEFKNQNGYWGNKYGIQNGLRLFNPVGIKNFQLQTELNLVSPFTYSHITSLDNYGHYYQPLAHSLGSNFIETIIRFQYYKGRAGLSSNFIYTKTGFDENNSNSGHDIYRPYNDRDSDYGYEVLNGIVNTFSIVEVKCFYLINPKWNIQFELGYIYRVQKNPSEKTPNHIISFGLRTLIGNYESYY